MEASRGIAYGHRRAHRVPAPAPTLRRPALFAPGERRMSVRLGDDFARVLAGARAGEDWAAASIYRSIQPALMRYLSAREPREAEDIAAQVWFEVARSLPRFSGGENELRALVFTIGRRRLSNARRNRARRPEAVEHQHLDAMTGPDDPAAIVVARDASREAVALVVRLLPRRQADVVLLRVLADLSVDEVAAIVGRSPAAVRVIQHRALKRLAGHLRATRVTRARSAGM
jgi:RNA polymerase sigma-70 factor (ECF subfamily)